MSLVPTFAVQEAATSVDILEIPREYGIDFKTGQLTGEIVEKSYDTKNGARPVKRAVQTYLEDPLTEILLRKPNQKRITIKKIEQV